MLCVEQRLVQFKINSQFQLSSQWRELKLEDDEQSNSNQIQYITILTEHHNFEINCLFMGLFVSPPLGQNYFLTFLVTSKYLKIPLNGERAFVVVHKKKRLQTSILMFSFQTLSVSSSVALSLSQLGRIRITGMNEVIDGNIIIDTPGIISYYSYIDMSTALARAGR